MVKGERGKRSAVFKAVGVEISLDVAHVVGDFNDDDIFFRAHYYCDRGHGRSKRYDDDDDDRQDNDDRSTWMHHWALVWAYSVRFTRAMCAGTAQGVDSLPVSLPSLFSGLVAIWTFLLCDGI